MKHKCSVCGYIHDGPNPPGSCLICGAAREKFKPLTSMGMGDYFRFLQPGWWIVHLIGISLVYALGNLFWR